MVGNKESPAWMKARGRNLMKSDLYVEIANCLNKKN